MQEMIGNPRLWQHRGNGLLRFAATHGSWAINGSSLRPFGPISSGGDLQVNES